jgi:chitobiase/beta-hexosaminidase-like protein
MYLVACTLENNTLVWRLHAVDITSGTEPLTNAVISGTYAGLAFDGRYQTQRSSLTLSGNQVVFAFGAVELEYSGGYSGWVMAYSKQTLAQTGTFATVATGAKGGGVWQSGRPPAVDSAGNVYLFTGNGWQSGYDGIGAFSESVLKLSPANQLALVDWFTPSNWSSLDNTDKDLASSGPLVVPNTNPSLLAGGGKAGALYLLNTANLGHYSSTNAGALQVQSIAPQFRGGPVYWQRSAANGGPLLYNWGPNDFVKAYAFNGATLATTPTYQGTNAPVYPGGILSISANGDQPGTGILWATVAPSGNLFDDPTDPGVLYAMDASNVATVLWSSNMNSARDALGNFAKFAPPTIANGKVYVATFSNKVAVYSLLPTSPPPPPPTAATPTFSPTPGNYTGTQQVTLSDSTPGAVIYYTTDGTTPTSSSPAYVAGAPLSIGSTETIEAIAVASGYNNSAVASGTYTISAPVTTVSVSLSTVANVVGIGKVGTAVPNGGLDGSGSAYATDLLGTTITWSGATFTLGTAGSLDAVSNTTVPLPSGTYSSVKVLAAGVNGNQPNQTFVITYTDGTTTSVTQSLSDWHTPQNYTGESIVSSMPYRLTSTGATDARTFYLYGYSLAINSAKTVKSITLPKIRNVVALAIDLTPVTNSSNPPTGVSLTASATTVGIGTIGKAVSNGGLDGNGYAYATNLLGTSLNRSGATFVFGAAGAKDAVANATVPLPAGKYSSVKLLGTGVDGNQANQTIVVTYTDGTTTTVTQGFSDWYTPQRYPGESTASTMAYRVGPTGAQNNGPLYLYGYSVPINNSKTVKSITLPRNLHVVVLAIDLVP